MRPAGEVHLAVLQAAHAVKRERAESGKGATLLELAQRACVGYKVARSTVANLKRSGKLEKVGTCQVAGRNRPAYLYAPAATAGILEAQGRPVLDSCMANFGR
jgi:hypothetical protein